MQPDEATKIDLYPPIDPYDCGLLDVGDGNQIYWQVSGNPQGKPAVVLHGGPGSGSSPRTRRYFDPDAYRIIQFDQRGCGRSTPNAGLFDTDLSVNTTDHLIADIERLRRHLQVDTWLVMGGSWGVTLALAYAQQHSDKVSELVLLSVTNTTHREVEWVTRDMGRVFPREWEKFRNGVPAAERDGNLAAAYCRLLNNADPAVREKAAKDWCDWEDTHVATFPGYQPDPRYLDPQFRMVFARVVTHYWSNAAWREEGVLVRDAVKLAGIPGVLVHGRLDISGPPDIAWQLSKVWTDAELVLVDEAGHGLGHIDMKAAVLTALDRFTA